MLLSASLEWYDGLLQGRQYMDLAMMDEKKSRDRSNGESSMSSLSTRRLARAQLPSVCRRHSIPATEIGHLEPFLPAHISIRARLPLEDSNTFQGKFTPDSGYVFTKISIGLDLMLLRQVRLLIGWNFALTSARVAANCEFCSDATQSNHLLSSPHTIFS